MTPAPASLRARLLRRVLVPLALVSLLGGAAVLTVSWVSTSQALDRSLLDDAYAIAAHVKVSEGRILLDLTEREVGAALFDHREQLSFTVLGTNAAVVAGEPRLKPVSAPAGGWAFGRQTLDEQRLRTVTLRREGPQPFSVTVAQTTNERTRWLARLAGFALLPQIVLLIMLAWWLGRSITEEVAPLGRLQRAVDQRDATDLSPVDTDAPSREVLSLARALNALMRRVAGGVAAQREFAGNVAHELRTPLAGIRALAAYALARDAPAVWRSQLEAIAASEERASRLVEQLLALAFADEARDGLPLGPVAIDELVRETVLRYLPVADSKGVEIGASGLDQSVTAWGHAALIEGALGNLIHNALQHGRPRDGRPAALSVGLAADAAGVRIAVSDSGPGIAPGERDRMLQRWSQTGAKLTPREGSGLGLAIAARYAALMGGRLTLHDTPGGGLTAVLELSALPVE
jgi:two-component system sensor histidine kinase TctE